MRMTFVFVPPGGGEADYQLEMEVPGVPQPGDYISITRPGQTGTEDFIVRRTWWHLAIAETETPGKTRGLVIECEFAIGHRSNEDHEASARRQGAREFEATAF